MWNFTPCWLSGWKPLVHRVSFNAAAVSRHQILSLWRQQDSRSLSLSGLAAKKDIHNFDFMSDRHIWSSVPRGKSHFINFLLGHHQRSGLGFKFGDIVTWLINFLPPFLDDLGDKAVSVSLRHLLFYFWGLTLLLLGAFSWPWWIRRLRRRLMGMYCRRIIGSLFLGGRSDMMMLWVVSRGLSPTYHARMG